MIDRELRKCIAEIGGNNVVVLDNPSFDQSIVGMSTDDRVIYDWTLMVDELVNDENMSHEDAIEFISYNTMRAIPYLHDDAPIIMVYNREYILEG